MNDKTINKSVNRPLVSVLMTAYNREDYIAEAIESVLKSTYSHWELIVVDDGSSDDTVAIAQSFVQKDNRIKVYVNKKNIGQFKNRNFAASLAKGKYIKYLDSDDAINKNGIEYCVNQMEQYPNAGMGMYSPYVKSESVAEFWPSEKIIREHFFVKPILSTGPTGTIINRENFESIGRFDTRFGVPSDMFFNIKFAARYPIVLLPELFVFYRRHDRQEINNKMDYLIYGYLYLKEIFDSVSLPISAKDLNFLRQKLEKRHAVNLLKFIYHKRDLKTFNKAMKATSFSPYALFLSLFK
jgi:glycosyltransferase involved in cell wall biosynthesis